jgi:hypothetical protein
MMLGSDRIIQEDVPPLLSSRVQPSINKAKNKAVVTKTQIQDASRKHDQFIKIRYFAFTL